MKELQTNKIDAMLSVASEYCIQDEAKDFLGLNITDIEDKPKLKRKILGYRAAYVRKNIIKIACASILICFSLAFTACMCVPNIRTALWNAFLEWHDDHVGVSFGDETTAEETELPDIDYPKQIEDIMELTYFPEEYIKGEELSTLVMHRVDFYSKDGEFAFYISQYIVDGAELFIDNELGEIIEINVHEYPALLIEYYNQENTYMLIWQDNSYRYTIYGKLSSITELRQIAEGVK